MKNLMKVSRAVVALVMVAVAASAAMAINPLEALKGVVNEVTSTDKFEVSSLEGTWTYESPAVSFRSDNALSAAGGMAAASTIESKMAPYYSTLGLDTAKFVFDKDGNFTLTIKGVTLKGTVTKDNDEGNLTFNFQAAGAIKLGKVSAQAKKSALGSLTLTFDATRVMSVVTKVAQFSGISTLQTLSSLLSNYDGLFAGARFAKSK